MHGTTIYQVTQSETQELVSFYSNLVAHQILWLLKPTYLLLILFGSNCLFLLLHMIYTHPPWFLPLTTRWSGTLHYMNSCMAFVSCSVLLSASAFKIKQAYNLQQT